MDLALAALSAQFLSGLAAPALPPKSFGSPSAELQTSVGTVSLDLSDEADSPANPPFHLPGRWKGITLRSESKDGSLAVYWDLAWTSEDTLFARLRTVNQGTRPIGLHRASALRFLRSGRWKGGRALQFDPFLFGYNKRQGLQPLIEGETVGGIYAVASNKPSLVGGFLSTNKTLGRTYVTPQDDGLVFSSEQLGEGVLLNSGAIREFEWLFVTTRGTAEKQLERFGSLMAQVNKPRRRFDPSAAWCTWYSSLVWPKSLGGELERYALANLEQAASFRPYGLDRIRVVDDAPFTGPLDYPIVTDALPNGYRVLVEAASKKGMKVGVWFDSTRSNITSDAAKEHPEWFAKGPDGRPNQRQTAKGYADHYIIDARTAGGQGLYRSLAERHRATGIDYAFGDFTWNGLIEPANSQNPALTSVEGLRLGMLAFREGLGEDAYWLTQQLHGANWDLVDAYRVSVDSWGDQPAAYRNSRNLWFLHHEMFLCDPDAWRPGVLTLPWAEAWISWQVLGGHPLTIGGDMRLYTRRQREVLKRAVPTLKSRSVPLDLWDRPTGFASAQTFAKGDACWTTVQASNFRAAPVQIELMAEAPMLVRSFWRRSFLGSFARSIKRDISPGSGETLLLYPDLGRPQIVGVGDHLEQGAISLTHATWDEKTLTLSGEMKPFSNEEPMGVEVFIPDGWALKARLDLKDKMRRVAGGMLLAALPDAETHRFSLRFAGKLPASKENQAPKIALKARALLPQAISSGLTHPAEGNVMLRAVPQGAFDTEPMEGAHFHVEQGDTHRFSSPFSPKAEQTVWHHDKQLLFWVSPSVCRSAKRLGILLADPDSEARRVDVRVGLGDGSKLALVQKETACFDDKADKAREIWVDLPKGASKHGVRISVDHRAGANAAAAAILLAAGGR